jgi:hypothetical protein
MRTAVIRVNLNPAGDLENDRLSAVVAGLRSSGVEVIAPDFAKVPPQEREIELLLPGDDTDSLRAWAQDRCAELLGSPASRGAGPVAGTATFLSRGTDEDALGVVRGFGITASVERSWDNGEEIVTVTIPRDQARRAPESRLHTALEAALNCEVRIVFTP